MIIVGIEGIHARIEQKNKMTDLTVNNCIRLSELLRYFNLKIEKEEFKPYDCVFGCEYKMGNRTFVPGTV